MAKVSKKPFGIHPDGQVEQFTLYCTSGLEVDILNYGGIIRSIRVPHKSKHLDVVLGFDTLEEYLQDQPYLGAIIGRYCNRIAFGKFNIDGKEYQVTTNLGSHSLHGGDRGFDKFIWDVEEYSDPKSAGVVLSRVSPDGEEGFPGNLTISVVYKVDGTGGLTIEYYAETDRPTVLNLTNHSYFNLNGHHAGSIEGHTLSIYADKATAVNDSELIPTGKLQSVIQTPLDFNSSKTIGQDLYNESLIFIANGYDHNYVFNKTAEDEYIKVATVQGERSGIQMEVWTTEPCMQLYTSNWLDGQLKGKGGSQYDQYCAFCLETQHAPDAPNHLNFKSTILRPGVQFKSMTSYTFSEAN